jgi:subtilisin family serine protease
MIIVNATGNEGPGFASLWSPSDSPNVMSVGSVNSDGNVSNFSGRGPTADGRIKPDIVALGESVYRISPTGSMGASNGTSYATPLITSGIALIKQIKPYWDVHDILSIFEQYSTQAKNNETGWGIPDFGQMIHDLKENESEPVVVSAFPNPSNPGQGVTILSPRVVDNQVLIVYNLLGQEIWKMTDSGQEDSIRFYIPPFPFPSGIYLGRTGGKTVKFTKY